MIGTRIQCKNCPDWDKKIDDNLEFVIIPCNLK